MEGYQKRAEEAEQLLEIINSRIATLEKHYGSSGSTSTNSAPSSVAPTKPATSANASKITVLKFQSAQDASNFIRKNDKFWLFNATWNAELHNDEIHLSFYDPLSDEEFAKFSSGNAPSPSRLCRFDQFFHNQFKVHESLFQPDSYKIEHRSIAAPRKLLGALGNIKKADSRLDFVLQHARPLVEKKLNQTFTTFEPLEYASQIVAGTNYFIKVKTESKFLHLRVFVDLQHNVALHSVKEFPTEQQLEYF